MNSKDFIIFGLLCNFFLIINYCYGAVTEEQMLEAGKLMRDVCQPKFKISNDVADAIKLGDIPEDKQVKCYINCILEMSQIIKKGKLNYSTIEKQIELLIPDHMKDDYKNGLKACLDAGDGIKNGCEVAYLILKCFVANVPKFVFP